MTCLDCGEPTITELCGPCAELATAILGSETERINRMLPGQTSADCRDGSHRACDCRAWSDEANGWIPCSCECHDRRMP